MKAKDFIKSFTKTEILDALFSQREFERLMQRMCVTLYERKSEKLLTEMERIADEGKESKTAISVWKNQKDYEKVDLQLDKLSHNFERLES